MYLCIMNVRLLWFKAVRVLSRFAAAHMPRDRDAVVVKRIYKKYGAQDIGKTTIRTHFRLQESMRAFQTAVFFRFVQIAC
jgi:hypothetical protein